MGTVVIAMGADLAMFAAKAVAAALTGSVAPAARLPGARCCCRHRDRACCWPSGFRWRDETTIC
jgi:hypothetical protein